MLDRHRNFLSFTLPAIVWTVFVLGFSSASFSAAHTGGILEMLLAYLLPHPLLPAQFEALHMMVRKAAHVTEYAILSALLFRAVRQTATGWMLRWAAAAVTIALAVATVDEVHQSFVPSRTGSPVDVAIDTVGAVLGQLVLAAALRRSPIVRSRE